MSDSELIAKLKEMVPVSDIARRYTELWREGDSWRGVSPFDATNKKNHASFRVSDEKGIWSCHSTNKSGDVISLLMEKEGYSFPEAMGHLAEIANIPLSDLPNFKQVDKPDIPNEVIQSARDADEIYICETEMEYKELQLQGKKNILLSDSKKYPYLLKRLHKYRKQYLFILSSKHFSWLLSTGKELYALTDKMFIKVLCEEAKVPLVEYLRTSINNSKVSPDKKRQAVKKYLIPLVDSIKCSMTREYNRQFINTQ